MRQRHELEEEAEDSEVELTSGAAAANAVAKLSARIDSLQTEVRQVPSRTQLYCHFSHPQKVSALVLILDSNDRTSAGCTALT